MSVAQLTADMSTCSRLQVGAVITDWRMEAFVVGYNGGPRGGLNHCRHPEAAGACGCIHAEVNAALKANFPGERRLFVTDSPCAACAAMLINANIRQVTYQRAYRDDEGLDVLGESGVEVIQQQLAVVL